MIMKWSVLQDLTLLRDQKISPNADYCSFIADLEAVTNIPDITWKTFSHQPPKPTFNILIQRCLQIRK